MPNIATFNHSFTDSLPNGLRLASDESERLLARDITSKEGLTICQWTELTLTKLCRQHSVSGDENTSSLQQRVLSKLEQRVEDAKEAFLRGDTSIALLALRRVQKDLRPLICSPLQFGYSNSWQSPPNDSSLPLLCGRPREASESDYKRDRHSSGEVYEELFVRSYCGNPSSSSSTIVRAFLSNSGMLSLSTLLTLLKVKNSGDSRPFLIDRWSYHETRYIAENLFGDTLEQREIQDTQDLIHTIKDLNPQAVLFDCIQNSPPLRAFSSERVVSAIAEWAEKPITIIIDNTACGPLNPLLSQLSSLNNRFLTVVLVESLAKLHQLGMDIVTAGISVVATRDQQTFTEMQKWRTHFGAQISEASARLLPKPCPKLLIPRLKFIAQGTEYLSLIFHDLAREHKFLRGPAVADSSANDGNTAPYFNVNFTEEYASETNYRRFVELCIEVARDRDVPLVAGTSFGFDVTRIYFIESSLSVHSPFLRIAPGTETLIEREALAGVFKKAFLLLSKTLLF